MVGQHRDGPCGYYVFRDGVRVNLMPIDRRLYLDAVLVDGMYAYQVSALDVSGNESARSAAGSLIAV